MSAVLTMDTIATMAERIKVSEAVRRTGLSGTAIFLAIRHGEITSQLDERGYDWVDPDEVTQLVAVDSE